MSERYKSMAPNLDVVFVMGGVNDLTFSVPLGTPEDETDTTFHGAVKLLCRNLMMKYPKAIIVFITPTLQTKFQHSAGTVIQEFTAAMKAACENEGVLCMDAMGSLGINPAVRTVFTDEEETPWTTTLCTSE